MILVLRYSEAQPPPTRAASEHSFDPLLFGLKGGAGANKWSEEQQVPRMELTASTVGP